MTDNTKELVAQFDIEEYAELHKQLKKAQEGKDLATKLLHSARSKFELTYKKLQASEARCGEGLKEISQLNDTMPDSAIPDFFKRATGRSIHKFKETCTNDLRRMLMLFWNERINQILKSKPEPSEGST